MTNDRLEKLYQVMDKIGVGRIKDGDDRSEKLRNFIDLLHSQLVVRNSPRATTYKPQKPLDKRYCYQLNDWVKKDTVCERCRIATPKAFLNCPEVLKEQGIEVKNR